jgi:hypothetical protein
MFGDENDRDGEEQPWEDAGTDGDADEAEAEQLALDPGDEALPWLDSEDDYGNTGVDTARIVAFALIGLLVIGLIVGGIWWFTQDRGGDGIADGSTIAAPEGPIKTRPDDPGGKTFEGTGDTSFAVGEGQTREGVLASEIEPRPSIDAATVESAKVEAAAVPARGGVGVQVGAYSTRARAEQGWATLVQQHSALSGVPHRVIEGEADIGRVFRLQAVAADRSTADSICARIKAGGGSCQVKP